MYLTEGEKLTLRDLVYGIMLSSGNDAATAVAEYLGGDSAGFSAMMNGEAAALGLRDTSFANPHGLDHENHYTTAYDLAQLTRYALQNPEFAEIVSTRFKTVSSREDKIHSLSNHNKMLTIYEGADGVKTGFTKKSGRCLVSSATRDCLQLIAVTLNAGDDWNDHTEMLDYGFSNYQWKSPIKAGDYMKTVAVLGSDPDVLSLYAASGAEFAVNGEDDIRIVYDVPDFVRAPVVAGAPLGVAEVYLSGEKAGTVALVTRYGAELTERNKLKHTFFSLMAELLGMVGG
jgi:D-alanyl-D-alanine carboxypeptidase